MEGCIGDNKLDTVTVSRERGRGLGGRSRGRIGPEGRPRRREVTGPFHVGGYTMPFDVSILVLFTALGLLMR